MIERRTYVTPLYAGSFLPEEGKSVRVAHLWTARQIVDEFADTGSLKWFALEVVEQNWQLWESGIEKKWLPVDNSRKTWRIYIGEFLTSAEVAALPGNHETLLTNMRVNGWDPIVRTRLGNFQPFEDGDVLFTEEQVTGG